MSLKTTPRGLLAALAALCIVLLQLPTLRGGMASAAALMSLGPRTAAPADPPTLTVTPTTVTRCQTTTVSGTGFAPGVLITPTLSYTNVSGVASTAPLTTTGPITTSGTGTFTASGVITNAVAYSTTAAVSVTSSSGVTLPPSGFPLTVVTTPTLTAASGTFVAGMTNTLTITSSPSFLPSSPISFTFGLSGTAPGPITPTAPVASDSTGAFSATIPFSVAVAGTYALTATDSSGCNVATTAVTVLPVLPPGPAASTTYFAEGYTGSGAVNGKASYTTTLDLLNPNVSSVLVTDTYLLETSNEDITFTASAPDVVVVTHTLPPLADMSVNIASDIAAQPVITGPDAGKFVAGTGQKVATVVQTAGFLGAVVRGVAAERLIERTASSGAREDGDVSLGTTSVNTSYYFAEGFTGSGFQEYLILLNPSPTLPATVTVTRAPEGAATTLPPLTLSLAPFQRLTVNVNRLNVAAPESKIGLIVNSTNPIVAERVLYFGPGNGSAKSGETIAAGLTTAAKQLNFAYGSLTGGFDVANPATGTIPAVSDVAQTVDDRPFIEVMNPNIAGQVVAGTVSGSATAPGPSAHVTISLRGEDGRLLGFFITDVDAGARFTLAYKDLTSGSSAIGFPGVPQAAPTRAGVFSAVVSSSERVVAELAQYFGQGGVTPSGDANSGAPGLALVGAPSGETDVLFPALGTTDPASTLPLSNTVFLYNPGVNPVQVTGTFYGASGVVAHQVYTVGPDAIQAIGTITATMAGAAVGAPIPAGTMGAEFSTVQQRGNFASGEPGQAPETFVAAAVSHSADGTNWWGSQGLYPLPVAPSCSITDTTTGLSLRPLPGGCP